MKKLELPGWLPDFADSHPIFDPLRHLASHFSHHPQWPGLADFQALLDAQSDPICALSGKAIKVVEQAGKPQHFADHYTPRIYMKGELQTRTENWHDFFQYLSWFMFPNSKAYINSLHIPNVEKRCNGEAEPGRRFPLENMLSLFDEGGAVLVSSDETLLQLVRDFEWKQLFWQRRDELAEKFKCITYGHAVYEKGLVPYIGMTANCFLFKSDETFFNSSNKQQLAWIDEQLTSTLKQGSYQKPKDLSPFPILGLPGWDNNDQESYYDNTNYFRPGRKQAAA